MHGHGLDSRGSTARPRRLCVLHKWEEEDFFQVPQDFTEVPCRAAGTLAWISRVVGYSIIYPSQMELHKLLNCQNRIGGGGVHSHTLVVFYHHLLRPSVNFDLLTSFICSVLGSLIIKKTRVELGNTELK